MIDTREGDLLLERVMVGGDDTAANDLLHAFFAGYPRDRLRLLLHNGSDEAVRGGAWILSELGSDAASLADELPALLRHRLKYARFFAVDATLSIASANDGAVVAIAIALIDDPEDAVRWKVLGLLSRGSHEQLQAAVPFLTESRDLGTRLSWLLDEPRVEDVLAHLASDRLDRMFAAAAATRLNRGRRQVLERAAASDDRDVSSFALEMLDTDAR
jgi:hypothetical protein